MKMFLSLSLTSLLILIFVSSCSLYQSEGRKFLKSEGLEFAAQGQNLIEQKACQLQMSLEMNGFERWPLPNDISPHLLAFIRIDDSSDVSFVVVEPQTRPSEAQQMASCQLHYPSFAAFQEDEENAVYGSAYAIEQLSLTH